MEQFIQANEIMINRDMAMGSKCGLTARNMKGTGCLIKQMGKEDLHMEMEMYMKVTEKMTKPMGMEFICILTELSIKASGKMISSMEKEWKLGLMELDMKEIISMEKSMAEAFSFGLMEANMMGSFKIIIYMEKVNTPGEIAEFIQENERTTKWMGMDYSDGLMGEATMASMWKIRNKDMELLPDQMVENTRDFGLMGNSMGKGFISLHKEIKEKESGMMEKESNGL